MVPPETQDVAALVLYSIVNPVLPLTFNHVNIAEVSVMFLVFKPITVGHGETVTKLEPTACAVSILQIDITRQSYPVPALKPEIS